MTLQFTPHGPHTVPTTKLNAGKTIDPDDIKTFWAANASLASRKGCYVFAMQAGAGLTPFYVGKATKGFKQEVFTAHKLNKYAKALASYASGTPVLLFVLAPQGTGATNLKAIKELEKYLIQRAADVNPNLTNIQNKAKPTWGIAGVLRAKQGKPSKAAQKLRKCIAVSPVK
jgi:hypothetical protein